MRTIVVNGNRDPLNDLVVISLGDSVCELNLKSRALSTGIFRCSDCKISAITTSYCGRYVISAYENGSVCCWNRSNRELLGQISLKKRVTSIVYARVNIEGDARELDVVIVSDKAGDLTAIDLPFMKTQLHFGAHTTSIVTDMCFHRESFLITADRDEKIRVTKFPELYTIESYCLGHTSVISSLTTPSLGDKQYLASVGWDHNLILWEPCTGKLLHVHSFSKGESGKDNDQAADIAIEAVHVLDPLDDSKVGSEDDDEGEIPFTDDSGAGNYPFRISAAHSLPLLCVIFKNSARLALLELVPASDGSDGVVVVDRGEIALPAPPCDIAFSSDDAHLLVLLPAPYLLQLYSVEWRKRSDSSEVEVPPRLCRIDGSGDGAQAVEEFNKLCVEKGNSQFFSCFMLI